MTSLVAMKGDACKDARLLVVDAYIVGATAGKGKYRGTLGSLDVRTEQGEDISVSDMTDAERDDLWWHQDLTTPRWVVVGFMGRDTKGGCIHPRFIRFHDKKNL